MHAAHVPALISEFVHRTHIADKATRASARRIAFHVSLAFAGLIGTGASLAGVASAQVAGAASAESTAAAASRSASVGIVVGDHIRIKVWREPTFSDSVTVDERGGIVAPRIGRLRVAGLTIGSLRDTLESRLSYYVRDPALTVTIYRRVGLQGDVYKPGLYYVDPTMSLREVLALGGGITENGNPDDVSIVRDGASHRAGSWRTGTVSNADLRSGDAIVVGRRSWLSRNALAAVSTLGLVISVGIQALRK